jgi:hypothetical protein
MSESRSRALLAFCACAFTVVAACASPAKPVPTAGAEAVSERTLWGQWAEFWAMSGGADTQRYAFSPDARFEWQAAPSAVTEPMRRRGTWELAAGVLILHVTSQESRANVTEAISSEERLELGACPPNEEAHALDASYRCISIRGRAFWHRPTKSSQ